MNAPPSPQPSAPPAPPPTGTDRQRVELLAGQLATLNLQPNDTLVVMFDGRLSQPAMNELRASFAKFVPGRPVLILEQGLKLAVLRTDA